MSRASLSCRMLGLWVLPLLVIACNDSSSPIPIVVTFAQRLAGDYTAQTDSLGGTTYWARFSADSRYILLVERGRGIRTSTGDQWQVIDEDAGVIRIGSAGQIATLSENDSVLVAVDAGDTLIYARSAGMPNPDDWVGQIQILEEFEAPDAIPTDLSWDGTGIWFPGRVLGLPLQRMNPSMNLQIDQTVPAVHSGNAVAYTPSGFWVDDWLDFRLYKLYLDTGETQLATRFAAPAPIRGLSTAPNETVCISAANTVYLFGMSEGKIDTIDLFQPVEGLENIGSVIYAALGSDGIARLEGPPWRAEATYALSDLAVYGLAFDGVYWWLYAIDTRTETATRIIRAKLLS